jgi:hypothetical protein
MFTWLTTRNRKRWMITDFYDSHKEGSWSVQLIYKGANANGSIPLAEFVAMFGAVMILLSQLPSFHSLRYINLVSVILCLIYSLAATVGSVLAGINLFQKCFIKCFMCPNPLNFLHLLIIMPSWYTKVIVYSLLITDSFPCSLYIVQWQAITSTSHLKTTL